MNKSFIEEYSPYQVREEENKTLVVVIKTVKGVLTVGGGRIIASHLLASSKDPMWSFECLCQEFLEVE